MNHTKHLSAAAAVALCALATIAPSAARADGKSAMVSLAGLDLSTDAGQRAARRAGRGRAPAWRARSSARP